MPMTRDSGWHIGTMPWNRAEWGRKIVFRSHKTGKLVRLEAYVRVRIRLWERRPRKPWGWGVYEATRSGLGTGSYARKYGLAVTDEEGKVAANAAIRAMKKAL